GGELGRTGGGRRLVGAEHLLLALAVEQRLELVLLDRLAPDEDLRDALQALAVLGEDVLRALVGGLDDAPNLVVDLARQLVRVVRLGAELPAEKRLALVVTEHARPETLAHAEPHDHLLGGARDLLEIVR